MEEVFEAYYECRKHKRRTCNALKFEADYEANLVRLHREINDGTYKIGRSIAFIVTHPTKREVFAANFRDRIVHHLIVRRLEPLFERVFIDDNYNCRKGKGVLYGVKRLHEQVRECSEDYTCSCYIMKNDLQGFFMSIHKPTLWRMLEDFIRKNYTEDDINLLLDLTKKVVLNAPELNCVLRSPKWMWNGLAKNKSLFTSGRDCGLPIGNLTSQMFANFYLHGFDMKMKKRFIWYGRYVDDFYTIARSKEGLLGSVPTMRRYLKEQLGVTLHPKKLYLQHYTKGVKFTGSVVKGRLMYAGSRTVGNMLHIIRRFNKFAREDPTYIVENVEHFVCSINSYFGFLSHYKTYAIRRKIVDEILPLWSAVCYVEGHFAKVVCRKEYKQTGMLRRKIINNSIFI